MRKQQSVIEDSAGDNGGCMCFSGEIPETMWSPETQPKETTALQCKNELQTKRWIIQGSEK